MATGAKMAFNPYQSGKLGNFPQTSFKDVEISQDLHLKMSKKIAQLTKVIYALNTKNDESESAIQMLRDQHEEQIQQILSEAKQKVSIYKDRLDEESKYRTTIETLQAKIAEYEVQKSSTDNKFATFKAEMKESQKKMEENYSAKLLQISQELSKAKDNFEEHLKNFKFWKEKIAAEHAVTIAEIERKHQSELEDLRNINRNQDDIWLSQCAKVEEELKMETEELKSHIKILEADKIQLTEDYMVKLEKATAFYEKELEVLHNKHTQDSDHELERMRKEIDRLKSDFGSSDKELRTQIDRLVHQLADTEDELKKSQKELLESRSLMARKDSTSNELTRQLKILKEELAVMTSSFQNVEIELAGSKQHCNDIADDLLKKSSKLGELEAFVKQKDDVITSLQSNIDKLTAHIRKLEVEKSSLLIEQQSLTSDQKNVLKNLQEALKDMTIEKETLQERLDKQIKSFQQELSKQSQEHQEEINTKLEEAEMKLTEALKKERNTSTEVLLSVKQELQQLHESEMDQITQQRNSLQKELNDLKTNLFSKLASAESEIVRLENIVKRSEDGLGSASEQLINLKNEASRLRSELDATKSELLSSKATITDQQDELDKLKVEHADEVTRLKQTMNDQLQSLSQDLNLKWNETMKSQITKLRKELSAQKENEMKAALSQLSQLKDEEIATTRASYEYKLDCLKSQVEELQASLDDMTLENDVENAKLKYELEKEKSRSSKDMLEAANEYSSKLTTMEIAHTNEMNQLRAQLAQEKDDLEAKLKKLHMEEFQTQMTAHKAVLDSTIKLEQRQKQEALEKEKSRHQEETERLRTQLEEKHKTESDALIQIHTNEIRVVKMELERTVEISKQKERDHLMQQEGLQEEIERREKYIKKLQSQAEILEEEVSKMKMDIEAKGLEVKEAHKQASQQLRLLEERLTKQNQTALDNLTADHLSEQQNMLAQFTSAQDLLKNKLSVLQIELEEAHERYARRESRPEDLDQIDKLRCDVSEREIRIKDLIDEKRFYQLELVNRETNFNKVFNASPNVGIMNPFQKPKKIRGKSMKPAGPSLVSMSGSSSGHQRLDPLPGSPLHDAALNPAKPLPQPSFSKKLVK